MTHRACIQHQHLSALVAIVAFIALHGATGAGRAVADEPVDGPRFALLIGVNQYHNLASHEQLAGSVNDVNLMRMLLQDRFGFEKEDIRLLTDKQATGEAIRRAMEQLVADVQALPANSPPAQVVFHFSGHGSQVQDQADGDGADEADGYDETLVPSDATKQGGGEDIRDDELHAFSEQICAGGRARLWLILDCCHSGTGVRGATRFRALKRSLPAAPAAASGNRQIAEKRLPPGAVAMYACQSQELEPEYEAGSRQYGLLTWFISQVVNEQRTISKLTYQQLADAVLSRYRRDRYSPRPSPTPRAEGAIRSIICNAAPASDLPPYFKVVAQGNRDQAMLTAGAVHGVTQGSLYELYAKPEQVDDADTTSVAWLRIDTVDLTTSRATVMELDDGELFEISLPKDFKQGFCIERQHHHGGAGAAVRVVRIADGQGDSILPPGDPQAPEAILQAFSGAKRETESAWLTWAGEGEQYDLILRIDGNRAAIFPRGGMSYQAPTGQPQPGGEQNTLSGGWGPYDLSKPENAAVALQRDFRRITRARNLIRVVETRRAESSNKGAIELTLQELRYDAVKRQITGRSPWKQYAATDSLAVAASDASPTPVVRSGQFYDWKITAAANAIKKQCITVLQIDANMGIQVMLPYQRGDLSPTLHPGKSQETGGFQLTGDKNSATVFGPRWTIVLATSEANYFSLLEQDSLPVVRSGNQQRIAPSGVATRSSASSLETLLLMESYFQSRGVSVVRNKLYDTSWSVDMVKWIAHPHTQ